MLKTKTRQAIPIGPKLPNVRWMIRRDMEQILEIEKLCFEFPWDEESFIRVLRQRNCIGMVVDTEHTCLGQVLGYIVYELHKTRLHILNFAVMPEKQRCGLGRVMHNRLVGKLTTERRNRILLEVCESNVDAQLFWRAMGYRCVSILRKLYEDTDEDAYVMQYRYQGRPCA